MPGSKLPVFPYHRGWSSTQFRRGLYTHEIRIPIKGGMTIRIPMGMVYLPIHEWLIFLGFHVGKYTSPMDASWVIFLVTLRIQTPP